MKSVAAGAVRNTAASLPVRGAWIEIVRWEDCTTPEVVAPRAGSVD